MSFKEVKELRKSGHLDEALTMALLDLEQDTDNIWNKRSAAWVYYEFLKKHTSTEGYSSFLEYLEKIKSLELPEEEHMIFDSVAFQVGKIVFTIQKNEPVDYSKINHFFEMITGFHFTKPSEAYSFLYKAFHKGYINWSNYLIFADWWNFEYFRSEDYLSDEYNGKKTMALVEQAYIAYAKKLLAGMETDKDKIRSFLSKLDVVIEKHPDYQYPPYFKAKLLLALGENENILSAFLPFAKKKRNDFWVWELLAEAFPEDEDIQLACLCKALNLKTPDNFLINIRQKMTSLLIKKSMFNEARTEIEKIITTRSDNNWRIPDQVQEWTTQPWYSSAHVFTDNKELYKQHIKKAEEILYKDIPEEVVVVEFVNHHKKILNFIQTKDKFGFFNYAGLLESPDIGDLLHVRFQGTGKDRFYKILTARKVTGNIHTEAVRDFKGKLKIITQSNIGFVEDIFFDSKILAKNNLQDNQEIEGKAILTFNKKKDAWGWKAFAIH